MNSNKTAAQKLAFFGTENQQSTKNIDIIMAEIRRQIRSIETYCAPSRRTQNLRNEIIALRRNMPTERLLPGYVFHHVAVEQALQIQSKLCGSYF